MELFGFLTKGGPDGLKFRIGIYTEDGVVGRMFHGKFAFRSFDFENSGSAGSLSAVLDHWSKGIVMNPAQHERGCSIVHSGFWIQDSFHSFQVGMNPVEVAQHLALDLEKNQGFSLGSVNHV